MKISNDKQKKQVIVLYGATLMGILLGVLTSVINTRALAPEEYGDVRYVQNIISFISSLLLVGYFTSGSRLLALSQSEEYSRKIRGAMCTILGITVLIMSTCMLCLYGYSIYKGEENLTPLYLIAIFLSSNVLMLNYVNTVAQGDNQVGRIAAARLLPSLFYICIAGAIYHYFGATSSLMLLIFNGSAIFILLWIILSTHPTFKNLKESFRLLNEENKKYGFQVYLGSLANVSTSYIAGITLGAFCTDNANVGFYTLALTIAMPLSTLPSIIGTTFFKKFASQSKIETKVITTTALITVSSLIVFVIAVGTIVEILYDESYKSVSLYASFLAIGTSAHGVGDMFNRFLGSHGQGKMLRNGAFVCGAVILIGSVVLVYYFQIYGAIVTKILGSLTYMAMMIYYYYTFSNSKK